MIRNNIIIGIVFVLIVTNAVTLLTLNKRNYKIEEQQEFIHAYENYYDNAEALIDSFYVSATEKWGKLEKTVTNYDFAKDSVAGFYL